MMLSQPEILSQFSPPTPDERLARHAREILEARPGPRARLTAWLSARQLDRALIEGADPVASPQLVARAAVLLSRDTRDRLAGGLERRLALARAPSRRWWAPRSSAAVLANDRGLRQLAALLRAPVPLSAPGIAATLELLTDASGPLYRDEHGRTLARALENACRRALAGAAPMADDGWMRPASDTTRTPAATDPERGRRPLAMRSA